MDLNQETSLAPASAITTEHKPLAGRSGNRKNLFYLRTEYYFDHLAAKEAVGFFENELHHVEGPQAGQLFILEPWQRKIIRHIYGWKRRRDGMRKFREIFIFMPRKNGKSFLGAGFTLYGLFADGEPGARVVTAAADRDQAALIFETSRQIVEENERLSQLCNTYRRSMAVIESASNYQVLSADVKTKHGKNLSTVCVDELHAQPNRDLVDVLFTSVGTRSQPLKIMLTTAGFDKNSICYEYYDYAKKVADGVLVDEEFLPIIFEPGLNDDWRQESTWIKANPNLGVTITWDYFRSEFKKAIERPSYENTFKRLHLNIWTEQETRWVPVEEWDACASPMLSAEALAGKSCYVGVDLASKTDICAVVLVFPIDGYFYTIPHFWVPADNIALRKRRDRVDYDVWVRQNLINAVPGATMDYEWIRRLVNEQAALFKIESLGFDPWNAQDLMTKLEQDNLEVVQIPQTFKYLSDATKELEALILSRRLVHGMNPVLRWMFRNVVAIEDGAGNIKLSKKKSKEKIDGIVALVNALSRYLMTERKKDSVYKTRGVRTL